MADLEAIYNWRRLDNRITTSRQPTEKQLADIHTLGVRHIVNLGLHTHEKALPDEAASVSRLGMTYIHIPVDFQNPTDDDFDQFCAAMERQKKSRFTSIASRTTGCPPSSTAITATCLAWAKPRRVPTWSRFGTRRASGRRLSVARLTRAVKTTWPIPHPS